MKLNDSMLYRFLCLFKSPVILIISLLLTENLYAAQKYSPNHVFAGVEYANQLVDKLLLARSVSDIQLPLSREKSARPMHVYELHVSVLGELYNYAVKNNRRPPPLVVSTPIKYTPTDVYYLTQLVINNLEEIYKDAGGWIDFSMSVHAGKSPADVYSELFELYYKLNLLNGKTRVSPSEVYAHIFRAKEDLQYSLLTLSKRLDNSEEDKKRLLVTAIYGMHTDGSTLSEMEKGKKPADVLDMALKVRERLNNMRKRNKLAEITAPNIGDFAGKVKPIDVFLQTQFIIAELNLLKIPMGINSTTNRAKPASGKTPSDVYQEMKHINYMLERLTLIM